MSITYQEALETLKSMFGEPWTESTLDAVLRHHEGHMENTVETVLGHGDGDPDELVRRLQDPTAAADAAGDGGGGGGSGTTSGRATPTHSNSSSGGGGGGGGSRKQRGIKTQLPPDFLVIPGYDPPSGSSGAGASTSGGAAQQDLDADEQLARMLQDELFTQELANNPEFAHLAGAGGRGRAAGSVGGGFPAARRSATSNAAAPQGPNVMDKIGEMGENAKKRLTLFARQFNDRMQNPQAHGGGGGGLGRLGGGGGGGGAGAGSSTAERRGLLDLQLGDDNDDEEVSFLGNNPVEMGSLSSPGGGGGKKDD